MIKRVVVTGGAGFIGSHVADALLAAGHTVAIVDDLSTGNRANCNAGAAFEEVDITSSEVDGFLESFRPDVICHHAAQISVAKAQASPLHDLRINVEGGLRLLEFARRSRCRFIQASSAAVYGEPRAVPVTEDHPAAPINNYGVSKLAFEQYLAAYAATYGVSYVVLRYANVYGPRQNTMGEAGVVAVFCEAVARGEPVLIHGDGGQSRDFVYVGDVADANVAAIASDATGIFNISTGVETDINRLLASIARAFGVPPKSVTGPARDGDIRRSVLAPDHAARSFGWRAKVDLDAGVEATARWFMSRAPTG